MLGSRKYIINLSGVTGNCWGDYRSEGVARWADRDLGALNASASP